MTKQKAVIVAGDMATSYGWGMDACWNGLFSKACAIRPVAHFKTGAFQSSAAGLVEGLSAEKEGSRVMGMLRPLLKKAENLIPEDAVCLLATTLGEIEYLERAGLDKEAAAESCPSKLLEKVEKMLYLKQSGMVVSAACASSSVAVAEGAGRIEEGEIEAALVIACDGVTEFLYAGFSSLLALDPAKSRPFDRDRDGLSVGEAAGWLLLMSRDRAVREGRKILGEVCGWGINNDANHMTGPSRDGSGLAKAIQLSLEQAGVERKNIASISAHGTGTVYNDSMEMKAFKKVFSNARPVYSVKGGIGHTMAAAGLIEILIALKTLEEQKVPPTVGLQNVDEEAQGWVSSECQAAAGPYTLSTNSGFGGVNAALLLKRDS